MGTLGAALQSIHSTKKPDDTPKSDKVVLIHYEKLHRSPYQYRDVGKTQEQLQKEVEEMAFEIMAVNKILQPCMVRKSGTDDYEIIGGHCRRDAAKYITEVKKLSGFAFVPCIIEKMTDVQAHYTVLSSNKQRPKTDYEIMHELRMKKKLLEEFPEEFPHLKDAGGIYAKLVAETGMKKSTIGEYLQISNSLSETAMEAFQTGSLNKSAAVSMSALSHEEQDRLIDEGITKQKDIKAYKTYQEEKSGKKSEKQEVSHSAPTEPVSRAVDSRMEQKAGIPKKTEDALPGQCRVADTDMELVEAEAWELPVQEDDKGIGNLLRKMKLLAERTDMPVHTEDGHQDYYIRLSDVIGIIEDYERSLP